MSAIRPGLPLNTPAQGLDLPGARSAQAAFFRAAMSQASAPQPAPAPAPTPAAAVMSAIRTATPARPVQAPAAPPAREEPRILRPGSYLDIRV